MDITNDSYNTLRKAFHLKGISKEIVTNVLNDPILKGIWTEVGTGVVNFKSVLEAAEKAGVEWGSVEQDQLRDLPPIESIKVSIQNLKKLEQNSS